MSEESAKNQDNLTRGWGYGSPVSGKEIVDIGLPTQRLGEKILGIALNTPGQEVHNTVSVVLIATDEHLHDCDPATIKSEWDTLEGIELDSLREKYIFSLRRYFPPDTKIEKIFLRT